MRNLTLVLLLVCAVQLNGQVDFKMVDAKVAEYPERYESVAQLATEIQQDFTEPETQVRAIYAWIGQNVSYSYNAPRVARYNYGNEAENEIEAQRYQNKLSKLVLQRRKAVCEGYSYLFKALCDEMGIECEVVTGFGRNGTHDIEVPYDSNHAWNLVAIDGRQYLIDATWGAGYVNGTQFVRNFNDTYFFTPPELFIRNHYPENPAQALLDKEISYQEFSRKPFYYRSGLALTVINPGNFGVLKSGRTVQFKIDTNIPLIWLAYAGNHETITVKDYVREDGLLIFDVPLSENFGDQLTIYYNGKAVIAYQVN